MDEAWKEWATAIYAFEKKKMPSEPVRAMVGAQKLYRNRKGSYLVEIAPFITIPEEPKEPVHVEK
jgi:hypothetical protein